MNLCQRKYLWYRTACIHSTVSSDRCMTVHVADIFHMAHITVTAEIPTVPCCIGHILRIQYVLKHRYILYKYYFPHITTILLKQPINSSSLLVLIFYNCINSSPCCTIKAECDGIKSHISFTINVYSRLMVIGEIIIYVVYVSLLLYSAINPPVFAEAIYFVAGPIQYIGYTVQFEIMVFFLQGNVHNYVLLTVIINHWMQVLAAWYLWVVPVLFEHQSGSVSIHGLNVSKPASIRTALCQVNGD